MRMAVYARTGQMQSSNTPATGGPGITGTVGAGETLTATTDLIEDEDGLTSATFTYQWLVDGAEINGATDSTYIVIAADEGKPIEVRVAFTDDAGNPESLTSNPFLFRPALDYPRCASDCVQHSGHRRAHHYRHGRRWVRRSRRTPRTYPTPTA